MGLSSIYMKDKEKEERNPEPRLRTKPHTPAATANTTAAPAPATNGTSAAPGRNAGAAALAPRLWSEFAPEPVLPLELVPERTREAGRLAAAAVGWVPIWPEPTMACTQTEGTPLTTTKTTVEDRSQQL